MKAKPDPDLDAVAAVSKRLRRCQRRDQASVVFSDAVAAVSKRLRRHSLTPRTTSLGKTQSPLFQRD